MATGYLTARLNARPVSTSSRIRAATVKLVQVVQGRRKLCCCAILGRRCRGALNDKVTPLASSSFKRRSRVIGAASFDHLVSAREQCRGNFETERSRSLEIDDEFDLRWLLDGQIGGLCTLQNFIHVGRCATVLVGDIWSVAYEPAIFDMLAITINRRQAFYCGQ